MTSVSVPSPLPCALSGCASISEHTNAYLGTPRYPPTNPANVQILQAEPTQPKDRLGEIALGVEGKHSRDDLELAMRAFAEVKRELG